MTVGSDPLGAGHGEPCLRGDRGPHGRHGGGDHTLADEAKVSAVGARHDGIGGVADVVHRHGPRVRVGGRDHDGLLGDAGLAGDAPAHLARELPAHEDQVVGEEQDPPAASLEIERRALQAVMHAGAEARDVRITEEEDGTLRREVRHGGAGPQTRVPSTFSARLVHALGACFDELVGQC